MTINADGTFTADLVATINPAPSAASQTQDLPIVIAGGVPPYRMQRSSGRLPRGRRISQRMSAITGTYLEAGAYRYAVRVTDSAGAFVDVDVAENVSGTLTMVVPGGDVVIGTSAETVPVIAGGVPPYTLTLAAGQLPMGRRIDGLKIVGRHDAAATFPYSLRVEDAAGQRVIVDVVRKVTGLFGDPIPTPPTGPGPYTPITPTAFLAGPAFVVMGDSRMSAMHNDQASTKRNRSAASHLVVMAAQLGQRQIYVANYAKAGERSDQYNSSTATMQAAVADTLFLGGVVNDIGQGRTGAACWGTIKDIIDAAFASGKKVIAQTEPGSESFGAVETGYRDTFNASLLAYRDANPTRLAVFDYASACLVNFAPGVIPVFKTGYAADETIKVHLSHLGARMVGTVFAAWGADKIGGTPKVLANLQTGNLFTNPGFTPSATTPSGWTGVQPTGWTVSGVGGTIAINNGEVALTGTATAAGQRLQITQQLAVSGTGLVLNDKIRCMVQAGLDAGATNIRSVRAVLTSFYNGTAIQLQHFDMQPDTRAIWGDTSAGFTDLLEPDDMTLFASGATTVDRIDLQVIAEFSASGGQATMRVKLPTLLKVA